MLFKLLAEVASFSYHNKIYQSAYGKKLKLGF